MNINCLSKKSMDTSELWNYTVMDLKNINQVKKTLVMANLGSD